MLAIDGNAVANRTTFTNISIPSLSLAANEYIMLKWDDIDNTGSDHGLSVDDVTISWTVTGATPTVGFSTTTSNTSEGLLASVAVSMNIAPAADVTVTISDLGTGSASSGLDYTALSPAPTLTFLTSDSYPKVLNVSIPILDELDPENAETIDLGLAVTGGTATLGTAAHTVTIAASDLPTVGFATATSSVTESATATIDVSMNTAPASDLTVQVTRTGGTATSGTDFTTFPATDLTFLAAGSYPQTQSVSVFTTDDPDFESAETVILGVAITGGSASLGTASHTLTINDNELATIVINEVDYDNVGTDNAEYIELYNYGASAINLNGFKVELVNGATDLVYLTINLPNTSLAAGGYYVIGNSAGTPNINLVVTPTTNLIQNGGPGRD
ncbi:MAG: lamin tail domain-containing protein [Flavobacteriales bacterium]|nr:lamin tail domain-containing protein [Flavobacteriales bacterium]